jgi:hypothetical protein
LAILALTLIASGCGGGGSSSAGVSSSSSSPSAETDPGGEPSAEFLKKTSSTITRNIVKFGDEASVEEREAANDVAVESLEAREAADFATQCDTLTEAAIKEIPGAKNHGDCAAALKKFAEPLSESEDVRKDTLSGSIAALRVKGNRGFALFHGNDGKDYALELEMEDGAWKVGSITTTEL